MKPFKFDARRKCPVQDYARDVVSGKILAGKYVRLSCQRHLNDLESCHARGLYFDREAAEYAIWVQQLFPQSKGEFGGKPLALSPFQKFITGCLFGWKRENGLRRFRVGYVEVAKKAGKSTMLGAISNHMFYFDGEEGAEVYAAATTRDQAKIVYNEAVSMLRKLPKYLAIRKRIQIFSNSVFYQAKNAVMMALSHDAHTLDGKNPHFVSLDELHQHRTAEVFNILRQSMVSRQQPLMLTITTAGWDRKSVCWQQREFSIKVLEGLEKDDHFAYIATLDEDDDPFDEKVWIKANPNLGLTPSIQSLREEAERAKAIPAEMNTFLRLHMNVWTEQADRWVNMSDWDACRADYTAEDLIGLPCYGALDMSSTQDISSYSLTFPPQSEEDTWKVLHWFFVPRENIRERARRDRVDYDVWVQQRLIEATEGNVVDYNYVQKRIEDINEQFNVVESAYDRWNTTQMVTNLTDEGLEMVSFGQGYASMSAPTKVLGDLIVAKKIAHNGNPVLRWMVSNVAVTQDPAGNIKPDKSKSSEKIDGVVTMVMGIGIAQVADKPKQSSVVRDGLLIL